METTALSSVLNAKDGYSLALALLCVFILALSYLFKYYTSKIDSIETRHAERIEELSKEHAQQIIKINDDFNNRLERLIKSQRDESIAAIKELTTVINALNLNIEKKASILKPCDTVKTG